MEMGHWNKRKLREWIEIQKPNAIFLLAVIVNLLIE